MRTVLITGGAGFIGSHLAGELLKQGKRVVIIDDLSTGRAANLDAIKQSPNLECHFKSIFDADALAALVEKSDAVVHLAAAVGVRLIVESPVRTIETNVSGTEAVLSLAAKGGKTVLLASTSEVYGKSAKIPYTEEDDLVMGPPTKGRWSYACSKAIDEFLALAYHKERSLPVTIMRFFNTVGPRQTGRYGMVVPNFVRQALAGEPITIFGTGEQSRTFTHVKDVVGAVAKLMGEGRARGEIYNIGGNEEISITGLATRIKSVLGSTSPLRYIPYSEAYSEGFEDMQRRVPDTSKLNRLIGFTPSLGLDDIIHDVAAEMRLRPE